MFLSYRNDVTPSKSAGVGFRSCARSIAVTLTYLHVYVVQGCSWPKMKCRGCLELGLRSPSRWHIWFFDWATEKRGYFPKISLLKQALNCANVFMSNWAIVGLFSRQVLGKPAPFWVSYSKNRIHRLDRLLKLSAKHS